MEIILRELGSCEVTLVMVGTAYEAAQGAHRQTLRATAEQRAKWTGEDAHTLVALADAEHRKVETELKLSLERTRTELAEARAALEAERQSAAKALELEREHSHRALAVWKDQALSAQEAYERVIKGERATQREDADDEVSKRAAVASAEAAAAARVEAQRMASEVIDAKERELDVMRDELKAEQARWQLDVMEALNTKRNQWLLQAEAARQSFADEMRDILSQQQEKDEGRKEWEEGQALLNEQFGAQLRDLQKASEQWRSEFRAEALGRVQSSATAFKATVLARAQEVEEQRVALELELQAHRDESELALDQLAGRVGELDVALKEKGDQCAALVHSLRRARDTRCDLSAALSQVAQLWTAVEADSGDRSRFLGSLHDILFAHVPEPVVSCSQQERAPAANASSEETAGLAQWLLERASSELEVVGLCRQEAALLVDQIPVADLIARREALKQVHLC